MNQSHSVSHKASKEDLFNHLVHFLGQEAKQVAITVASLVTDGQSEEALQILIGYDTRLGGIRIAKFSDKRLLGVYRPLYYVYLPLRNSVRPQEFTRSIVYSSGVYLEELLKRMVRLGFIDYLRSDRLPLGSLVHKARKHLPVQLFRELDWFTRNIHNFAKHEYTFEGEVEEQPRHYFEVDEAIAAYLLARKLGVELEAISGMTPEQLIQD